MNYLLGIAAIIVCLILMSFDVFLSDIHLNVAAWGIAISIIYMALHAMNPKPAE